MLPARDVLPVTDTSRLKSAGALPRSWSNDKAIKFHVMRGLAMSPKLYRLLTAACFLSLAVPASAHHSFATKYDASKEVQLSGTVGDVHLQNPHSTFELNVAGKSWSVETENLTAAAAAGLNASNLKSGTPASLTGWPARDGSAALGLHTITLGGKTLTLRRSAR